MYGLQKDRDFILGVSIIAYTFVDHSESVLTDRSSIDYNVKYTRVCTCNYMYFACLYKSKRVCSEITFIRFLRYGAGDQIAHPWPLSNNTLYL